MYIAELDAQKFRMLRAPFSKFVWGPSGFSTDKKYGRFYANAAGDLVEPPEPTLPHTRSSLCFIPPADFGNQKGALFIGMTQIDFIANTGWQRYALNLDTLQWEMFGDMLPANSSPNHSACYDSKRRRVVLPSVASVVGGVYIQGDTPWVLPVLPGERKWSRPLLPSGGFAPSTLEYYATSLHYSAALDRIVRVLGTNSIALIDPDTFSKRAVATVGTPPPNLGGSEWVEGRGLYYYCGDGTPNVYLLSLPANPLTDPWPWSVQRLELDASVIDAAGNSTISRQDSPNNPHFHRFVHVPPLSDAVSDCFAWMGSVNAPLVGFRT